jgi:protein O-GlcNAcase/histone acetyltransferase
MANHDSSHFLAGVIEGFYGQPWSHDERLDLLDSMASWGLNTYLYAPKDDLRQRVAWRELYPAAEAEKFRALSGACHERHLHFVYALSPGLSIRHSDEAELEHLKRRFEQMLGLGCECFSLLFDDIPDRLDSQDLARFGSLASAQCHVANAIFKWLRQRLPRARLLFCPTAYCGRMVGQKLGGAGYLSTIGRELLPEIDVFWTGPEIISRQITIPHVRELQAVLRRKPLIWDNLHANDYDGRRFFCGPYAGRPPELRGEVSGLLSNPNNEFLLNYIPLRTLAAYVSCGGKWDAREAYLAAMRAWLPGFATCGQPINLDDLILFGDCYYLPQEEGPEAEALYQGARDSLARHPRAGEGQNSAFRTRATRLREFCLRASELKERRLFYALSRRLWDLREELDLLEHYVEFKSANEHQEISFRSDFHLPGTYRGGIVARLQRLLVQQPDGAFAPAPRGEPVQTNNQAAHLAPSLS